MDGEYQKRIAPSFAQDQTTKTTGKFGTMYWRTQAIRTRKDILGPYMKMAICSRFGMILIGIVLDISPALTGERGGWTMSEEKWDKRRKLYAEADKHRAEGGKLWAEGSKLYAEADKLRFEGSKLCAEADKLYAGADKLRAEADRL